MTDYVSIYISDPSLLRSKYFDQFEQVNRYEELSDGDAATGIKFYLNKCTIVMNFMPGDEIEEHLSGFAGYCQNLLSDDNDTLLYTLSRLRHVKFVIGCVVEPGFDENESVLDFLFQFSSGLNGLLFGFDSVLDYDGVTLCGPLKEE